MRVIVVWEPILSTDWRRPSGRVLGRIPDERVRQFWDPGHELSRALQEMAKQKAPKPDPACCTQKGFYWDQAILYPRGVRWGDVPSSAFWNGPVYRIVAGLESALDSQR